jgi:hypothetical protein
MTLPGPKKDQARDIRLVAVVIAMTMLLWMGVQVVGADMGWPPKYTLLADLAALAGFIWALVVTYQIWRKRRT